MNTVVGWLAGWLWLVSWLISLLVSWAQRIDGRLLFSLTESALLSVVFSRFLPLDGDLNLMIGGFRPSLRAGGRGLMMFGLFVVICNAHVVVWWMKIFVSTGWEVGGVLFSVFTCVFMRKLFSVVSWNPGCQYLCAASSFCVALVLLLCLTKFQNVDELPRAGFSRGHVCFVSIQFWWFGVFSWCRLRVLGVLKKHQRCSSLDSWLSAFGYYQGSMELLTPRKTIGNPWEFGKAAPGKPM